VQPEETQSILDEPREDFMNVGRGASPEVEEHDPTPATPVESAHTTPSYQSRRRQDDFDVDVDVDIDFDESPELFTYRDDECSRQRSISEDEAEADACFKQYVTTLFYPDDKAGQYGPRDISVGVTQPPDSITIQSVPNMMAQERKSTIIVEPVIKPAFGLCTRLHTIRQSARIKHKPIFAWV
jgi:hypothetical protein